MQVFHPYRDPERCARILDRKRLNKQIIEGFQILRANLNLTEDWRNHPNVKLWKGYERYLLDFVCHLIEEWQYRGYDSVGHWCNYVQLEDLIRDKKEPEFLTEAFFAEHRARLLRKEPKTYLQLFGGIKE